MTKFLLGTTALVALMFAGAAQAADMPIKAQPRAPAVVYDWTGFYIGGHGGFASFDPAGLYDGGGNPGPVNLNQFDNSTGIAGGQIGYNWQSGALVLGVEADISKGLHKDSFTVNCSSLCTSTTLSSELDYLFSVRGRLGFAVNNWLFFGTAGWGQSQFEFGAVQTPKIDSGPNGTINLKKSGAVVGGGIEYGFSQASLRVEFLHYRTGATKTFGNEELIDTNVGDFIKYDHVNVVRAGLNWRFGGR